ncbi:aryl-sulfate sulfotransferase [Lacinutrix neustonica]|uniref:Aryl-sulfate sulfotransferase n=1 Tax=Lacinutrix neustonica TaxID=2980107 RepID=A0A9E8MZZ5_9FLAO|nr:aryl-sulfate sulfotransferase [Lacinutrix neustonica]WAC03597.1 aryl-sulfate sulfotransferase [Lacinutrix neustonica]
MKQLYLIFLFLALTLHSQNTVGTITNDTNAFNGLTLFSPNNSTETYLINNCGEVVNQWTSTYTPAASVYLLNNGNLLRTGKIYNSEITFGGVGGKIELFDWENNLLWDYNYSTDLVSQHHDIYPLPNGNILILAVTTIPIFDAIEEGRDATNISEGKLFNEQILELQPIGTNQANIVWEWNIKDHLIQDFDATKNNYGSVANNPQRLDINFLNNNNPVANWLHINSMQYNENLDQIILSSRKLSEVYIIDHSTSTAEAASSQGGIYGKGGDFLYRWGNPVAYDHETSTYATLDSQHFPHWIPNGLTDAGKIMIFNNGNSSAISSLAIINPETTGQGIYAYDELNGFSPSAIEWTYEADTPTDFFSAILSSGQRLPNGNTLICDGDSGYFFEIDSNKNTVWEYVNPDTSTGVLNQGDSPALNFVFRAHKFPLDYPAFNGRDLTPRVPIEGNPDLSNCTVLSTTEYVVTPVEIKLYPNPVVNDLFLGLRKRYS